jgi:hypothetical protein
MKLSEKSTNIPFKFDKEHVVNNHDYADTACQDQK